MKPQAWNNIPVPLTDALNELLRFAAAIGKVSTHHEAFMDDLTMVTQNVFHYSEASCDDMREKVKQRFAILNKKSEDELQLNIKRTTELANEKVKSAV